MSELASPVLAGWESFYVIVGSSAAALIGMQFIVVTLLANQRQPPTAETMSAFGTPTVVHLASALLISAIMTMPWPSLFPASIAVAVCGLGGLAYGAVVIRRARRQTDYQPEWADWLWYALFPCSVYTTLMVTALFLQVDRFAAMFGVGVAALGLLLIAVHNAWDTVTHIVVVRLHDDANTSPDQA